MSCYLGDSEVPLVADMAVVFVVQLVGDVDTVRALPEHRHKPGVRGTLLKQATIINGVSTVVNKNHTMSHRPEDPQWSISLHLCTQIKEMLINDIFFLIYT